MKRMPGFKAESVMGDGKNIEIKGWDERQDDRKDRVVNVRDRLKSPQPVQQVKGKIDAKQKVEKSEDGPGGSAGLRPGDKQQNDQYQALIYRQGI